ncbi:glutamate--cysteine ligase [Streptomyces sp. NPDC054796]
MPTTGETAPTLGVEEEFFLVDARDGGVRASAPRVLARVEESLSGQVSGEFTAYQIEAKTPPCHGLRELGDHLVRMRAGVAAAAAGEGLRIVASGTPVLGGREPVPLREDPRYDAGAREYRALQDDFAFSALQTHVRVPGRAEAVLVSNHLRPWLPTLAALAANSPYWAGRDTGYASWRTVALGRWPAAGPPPYFDGVDHYDRLVARLLDSGAALDEHNVFWDVRPCRHLPTVEIRVMDVNAGIAETTAFAALVRALVAEALERVRRGDPGPRVDQEVLRAAYWRAARDGCSGHGLEPLGGGLLPVAELARRLLAHVRPVLDGYGELAAVSTVVRALAAGHGGAERRRAVYARRGHLPDVVADLVARTTGSRPLPPPVGTGPAPGRKRNASSRGAAGPVPAPVGAGAGAGSGPVGPGARNSATGTERIMTESTAGTGTGGRRTEDWWRPEAGFFGDLYKEADDSLRTFFAGTSRVDDRTCAEVDGVMRLCGLAPGARVLDCPCGYGRHSVELAARGVDVVGVDINPGFLEAARRSAARAGTAVRFLEGDMRELPPLEPVDAVINMFYSFGFFTPEEDLAVLRHFRQSLKPGGRFLMHTMVTAPALRDGRIPAEERRRLSSGRTLVSRRHLDDGTRREFGQWAIVDDTGAEFPMTPYDVRIYTPEEFGELCREAGFARTTCHGDWDGTPYEDASPNLIVVAHA